MRRLLSIAVVCAVVGLAAVVAAEDGSEAPVTWSNVCPADGFIRGSLDYEQCELTCPPGALAEGEPLCGQNYEDLYNGGCNSAPPVFQVLQPSCRTITVCGASGVYDYYGTLYRDTDWYQINLTETADIRFCCTAEFPLLIFIIDGTYGCTGNYIYTTAGPCQEACLQTTLPAGTYWLWVGPENWDPLPCGADYVMTVEGYGQGERDICCVVPPTLNFGSVEVGRYLDLDFKIINTWGEPLIGLVNECCDYYSIISGGGDYNLAPGESLTVTVRFAPMTLGEQTCQVATGIDCPAVECTGIGEARYCSFPCWSWAAGCLEGVNRDISTLPACIRDDHFADAFPSGLMVGVDAPGRHKAVWTSADAVRAFACGYGIPAALGQDYVDPASNRLGSIYGEAVALRMSREFSCEGHFTELSKCLGTAVVPPEVRNFAGITVDQLLEVADQALGGNTSALLPYGNSLFRLQAALAYMNQLYDDCGGLVSEARFEEKFDDDIPGGSAEPLPSQIVVTSHPNPLETSVTVGLALPAAGNVSMEIYDVQGRRVVTMASRPMSEGNHDVAWDGADDAGVPVAAGVYFLRVQVDGRTAVMHKLTKL